MTDERPDATPGIPGEPTAAVSDADLVAADLTDDDLVEPDDDPPDDATDELPSEFDDDILDDADYDAELDGVADDVSPTDIGISPTDVEDVSGMPVGAAVGRTGASVSPPAADVWRRAARGFLRPRLTGASAVIAVLIGLLGFALIAQVSSNNNASTLNSDRPEDLVRILSDLDSHKDRLDTEITNLKTQQQQLSSGAQSEQAALNAATQRADELGILAGTLPAVGPGLVIRMEPQTKPISSLVVLETIEELRGAGAEAMEISGTNTPPVRIIASTWVIDVEGGGGAIMVDGVSLSGTLTVTAIGDGQTLQTAMSIPGGVADSVHDGGGTVLMQQEATVQVTALAPTGSLKYAHPAS